MQYKFSKSLDVYIIFICMICVRYRNIDLEVVDFSKREISIQVFTMSVPKDTQQQVIILFIFEI